LYPVLFPVGPCTVPSASWATAWRRFHHGVVVGVVKFGRREPSSAHIARLLPSTDIPTAGHCWICRWEERTISVAGPPTCAAHVVPACMHVVACAASPILHIPTHGVQFIPAQLVHTHVPVQPIQSLQPNSPSAAQPSPMPKRECISESQVHNLTPTVSTGQSFSSMTQFRVQRYLVLQFPLK